MINEIELPQKNSKEIYYKRMIDTMKQVCYGCKSKDILVTLSCGCNTICEDCTKTRKPCCKEDHLYDSKVFIK